MKRKLMTFLALFFTGIGFVMAQTQVRGTVVDEKGEPIIGANIRLKSNPQRGAATDFDGKFTISAPENDKLIVSYIGFITQEVAVKSTLNIVLKADTELLDEVVVTGYGTIRKSSFTGAAATIDTEKLKDVPVSNLSDKLAGNISGVQINNISGQPGAVESIRIRGMGSINAGNNPLYVIDGVPMLTGDISGFGYSDAGTSILSTLNPNDIESMTVIKDAAAASLYGSRAANGVIVITTKKGKAGKTSFSFKSDWGFSNMAIDYRPVLDGPSRRELLYLGLQNYAKYKAGITDSKEIDKFADKQIDRFAKEPWSGWTNWKDLLYRTGKYQNYDISARGGNEKTKFYTSLAYTRNEGIFQNSDFDRLTGNANVSHQTDKIMLEAKSLFSYTKQNSVNEGTSFASPIMAVAMTVSPASYPYNEDGSLSTYFPTMGPYTNPMRAIKHTWNKNNIIRAFNTIGATYSITDALKIKEVLSYDFTNNVSATWWDPNSNDGRTAIGVYQKYMINMGKFNTQSQLTFDKTFEDKHNLSALLGYETEDYTHSYTYVNGSNYPILDNPKFEVENAAVTRASSHTNEYRLLSYLGRVNYDYLSKYYLSGSFRRDGSSRLAKDNRWGNFWSLSGAWRFTGEEFLEGLSHTVNDGKIRVSYGVNGTQPTDYYGYMPLYGFGWNYDNKIGMMETTIGNPDLRWEKNHTFNIGLDLMLLNRFSMTLEWYTRTTKDLLFENPMSATVGVIDAYGDANYLVNIGSMKNTGVELELKSTNIQKDDFRWNTSFTLAHNKNKILTLDGNQNEIVSVQLIHRVGEPYYSYFVREYAGVDKETGKELYYINDPKSKNPKETTTDAAKANLVIVGHPDPIVQGGLTNSLQWKYFDLNFTFTYSLGGHVYDNAGWIQSNGGTFNYNGNVPAYYKIEDTWQNPGQEARLPMFMFGNRNERSSRWMLPTDHLRLKNLTLGFTMPKQVLNKIGFDKVRLYMSGSNLLTIKSKDLYVDPENSASGLVLFRAPAMRTVTFGLELGF